MAVDKVVTMAKGQVYFTVGEDRKTEFLEWIEANGYDKNKVFLAMWSELAGMTHEERMALFSRVAPADASNPPDKPPRKSREKKPTVKGASPGK